MGVNDKRREIVSLDAKGRSSFQRLQRRFKPGPRDEDESGDIVYAVFDLLYDVFGKSKEAEGLLRQPVFLGLRDDKDPKDVVHERPVAR